jgi:hypothetical protein
MKLIGDQEMRLLYNRIFRECVFGDEEDIYETK